MAGFPESRVFALGFAIQNGAWTQTQKWNGLVARIGEMIFKKIECEFESNTYSLFSLLFLAKRGVFQIPSDFVN